MTSFQVDLAELDGVIGDLEAFADELARQLDDLRTTVVALQQDWLGTAADAQRAAHRRLAGGAEEMRSALVGLRAAARHAHGSYSASVEANRAMWTRLEP